MPSLNGGISVIRILFVSQFIPSARSKSQTGGTISNLNMLECLGRHADVTVLSFDPESSASDFLGRPFNLISKSPPLWRAPELILHWQTFVRNQVTCILESGLAPDLLVATTSTLGAFDVCPPTTSRVALVQAFENFGVHCPWVPWKQRINLAKLAAVRRFQDLRLMRSADAVLTNSNFMRSAVSSRFGIGLERIHVLSQSSNIAPSFTCIPSDVVGFVTRGPEKGLAFVLSLARRSPSLTYLIYGHSRDKPKSLPSNVSWQGWVSDRSAMFASAALWIVPSLWAEPFGRVSVEAQAANRAVLVAAHGGLPETVLDPRFQIRGFCADDWLSRMRELLQLPAKDISINGARIREAFSIDVHDCRLLTAVDSITNRSRPHANP
jgi:glycosyltransferase involved in cell wall biosynthesis